MDNGNYKCDCREPITKFDEKEGTGKSKQCMDCGGYLREPRKETEKEFTDRLESESNRETEKRKMIAPNHPHKPGRNEPCPCGSGKKYKKCCGVEKVALSLPNLCACLIKCISDIQQADKPEDERPLMAVEIPVKLMKSVPVNMGLEIKQVGDIVVMQLVNKESEATEPKIAVPCKNIILPGE